MDIQSRDDRMDLTTLSAEARDGLEARITAAVVARMTAEARRPDLAVVAREVEKLKWRALATAALLVLVSAAVGPVIRPLNAGHPAALPAEWIEALERAGAVSFDGGERP